MMSAPVEFDPQLAPSLIVVVGLGGTGAQIGRAIARTLYDMRRRSLSTPNLLFVDPDIVEEKNVGRQMFTAADVGKHKAEVLARRFNYSLGLDVSWRNEKFDHEWFMNGSAVGTRIDNARNLIICGAVDGHEGRAEIAKVKSSTWIDCGNHFSSGQVVVGNTDDRKAVFYGLFEALRHAQQMEDKGKKAELKTRWLPNVGLLFPQLLVPESKPAAVPDLSCADLVAVGDQHLLINDYVAAVAAQYVWKLLNRQPVTSFLTYVDCDGMSMRSLPITSEEMQTCLPEPEAEPLPQAG